MGTKKAKIEVHELRKAFAKEQVLDGVSFSVRSGQIFTLLGSNGAGKTTAIKILTTLLQADSGTVTVGGFDVVKQPEQVRELISLTGQFAAIDDMLTGRENLRMIGRLRHLQNVNQKADTLLQQFDLVDAANRSAGDYSGGMRRRLDLAMSLIGEPQILFLDEPTTGLDPQSRLALWDIIRGLAAAGTTIFLTTQYLEEAEQLADYIAILDGGKIVVQGTATELKSMLPHGRVELTFGSLHDKQVAIELLAEFYPTTEDETLQVNIITDGSVKQMAAVLGVLDRENLDVTEYAQKLPSLEDVFLTIVNKKNSDGVSSYE
ncbi:ATP-binding cassette domain-containing protein [Culicoidibacter larvae]|uniref:ATP-binding cassette domain-containing protein n=1 Tax=Culicoidibacter larvae TaxID=2579976 RepID=A0A5R8QA56_9FIRM|nr:ATP-binding cassette domain-containing protein [Culicoidibacter larvae]TLG72529.1 ATP-binding cassette domain-containing protein [Culicoidibacter larvae]